MRAAREESRVKFHHTAVSFCVRARVRVSCVCVVW